VPGKDHNATGSFWVGFSDGNNQNLFFFCSIFFCSLARAYFLDYFAKATPNYFFKGYSDYCTVGCGRGDRQNSCDIGFENHCWIDCAPGAMLLFILSLDSMVERNEY
jgi:hypothetical protein